MVSRKSHISILSTDRRSADARRCRRVGGTCSQSERRAFRSALRARGRSIRRRPCAYRSRHAPAFLHFADNRRCSRRRCCVRCAGIQHEVEDRWLSLLPQRSITLTVSQGYYTAIRYAERNVLLSNHTREVKRDLGFLAKPCVACDFHFLRWRGGMSRGFPPSRVHSRYHSPQLSSKYLISLSLSRPRFAPFTTRIVTCARKCARLSLFLATSPFIDFA